MPAPTANSQTQQLIEQLEQSRKAVPSLPQSRLFIRHVTLSDGVQAEIRLEIVTQADLFINKTI